MGAYVDVDGLNMYYEVAGEGEPVILLHGTGGIADIWRPQLDLLADWYQVFTPECRGHGRTADVEGPFSYENFADDLAGFIEALGLGPVRLVGWSNGAAVVLRLALRRPDLVRRLVLIGGTAGPEGETALAAQLGEEPGRTLLADAWKPVYQALSPDGPEHFAVVEEKLHQMWREGTSVGMDEIAALPMPLLVMQGDDDSVEIAHSAALAGTARDGRLAVVPGTSHAAPLEKPELVNLILLDFFEDKPAERIFPLGSLRSAAGLGDHGGPTSGGRPGFLPWAA
ncbi:alpha/beta hydrolase fold protein [Catenulispora acidiphila DSM 44928]|uniref:Alpha/beta hydrolase fold protein n=1 Tax=Catenulispora acidiphila (strain DSM 44928 / JCM 14897 / NBRC 102108 / NRRL B-24433 / ID139908) TaxID=479433 RepID=C7PVS4_CATAD|nr:alpha/beta hydrolase [Catenulispora acidiphila]ACU71316.1 alpha/beta hydrolase fold protein [Catenulispora acidiphila DSM 44928]